LCSGSKIENTEKVVTEAFSILTDNTETEICGIALALGMAIQHYTTRDPQDKQDNLGESIHFVRL